MSSLTNWGRFPSGWVESGELTKFAWGTYKSDAIAALRIYCVLAHRLIVDEEGIVKITYDDLMTAANMSRQSISKGLKLLIRHNLIQKHTQSSYQFCNYNQSSGWAKIPAKYLYNKTTKIFRPFQNWNMRSRTELDALKVYLFIATRRDKSDNQSHITYENISNKTGVASDRIAKALSLLIESNMILVTKTMNENRNYSHSYRLNGLQNRVHPGTSPDLFF